MFNGTSMASPQAAGAAALLVSAAKQTGVQSQPEQLRAGAELDRPLSRSSTPGARAGQRPHPRRAAWNLLATNHQDRRHHGRRCRSTPALRLPRHAGRRSRHPRPRGRDRRSELHPDLHVHPHFGWRWLRPPTTCRGSATTARSSSPASICAAEERAKDAHRHDQPDQRLASTRRSCNLDDPGKPGIEYQTMNVVIARDQFTAGNNYSDTKSRHDRPQPDAELLLQRPAGTPALKVDFSGPAATPPARARRASCGSTRTASGSMSNTSTKCYSPLYPVVDAPVAGRTAE